MAALGWLLNVDFAGGGVPPAATTKPSIFLTGRWATEAGLVGRWAPSPGLIGRWAPDIDVEA